MRKIGLAVALVVLVASLPALAAQGDKIVRFGAAYVSPTGDLSMIQEEDLLVMRETIEADAAVGLPGAAEVNDGLDNQCPGDAGRGLVDEISGIAGFNTFDDKTRFSWMSQSGAVSYEVARSTPRHW